jgi:hypothetical protein
MNDRVLGIRHNRFTTFKSFAGRALFDDVSLQVNRNDLIEFQLLIH